MSFNRHIPRWTPRDGVLPFNLQKAVYRFWVENPVFHEILIKSRNVEEARERIFNYLHDYERKSLHSRFYKSPLERSIGRRALHVLKNLHAKRNEELTGQSVLKLLFQLAHNEPAPASLAFMEELRHLFLAMKGLTGLFDPDGDHAEAREDQLSQLARQAQRRAGHYPHGLRKAIRRIREENRRRIMAHFGVGEEQWQDWAWQCRNVIRDAETLGQLVQLTDEERKAIGLAREHRIMFGVTPYYVSLMDYKPHRKRDHAVRAQVIPPLSYIEGIIQGRMDPEANFDFMGESFTSPAPLITRRYPMIAILKPYNTCAQICVYCQRNWEIDDVLSDRAQSSRKQLEEALQWFKEHPEVTEMLITGGDPAIMSDALLEGILDQVSQLPHIKRIRIGTRTPVVLPMRITEDFAGLLARYHTPGRREVAVMTHFEHPYEVTPEAMEAVQRLRRRGLSVYNQGVFTMENARRFEMAALRKALRLIGVSPYYTFNAKGKEETRAYRVPIARLLQEQAEESRLNPGLDRTDEAVFNIPRLGKNYLRAGQDHELIMLTPQGNRIYEFFPWDLQHIENHPYLYTDVPIADFLLEMEHRDELVDDYRSIWYYY